MTAPADRDWSRNWAIKRHTYMQARCLSEIPVDSVLQREMNPRNRASRDDFYGDGPRARDTLHQ